MDIKGHGYLQRIRFAAERMGQLIDDLLKLSRLTRAEMRWEPVDLSGVARSLVAGLATADPEREVEVVIAPDIRVMGDPALLRILMDNLLGNAWKFTARTLDAKIEVGGEKETDGKVSCFVRDNGAGFDKRYIHKLFGPFQRLHSQVEFPGTGIGLATVQRIVRRHGGEVRADGEINHGATFGFTLEAVSKS
jgi:light-regulated signal transduction histidine kinase (bacteriophytochrome)